MKWEGRRFYTQFNPLFTFGR